MIWKMAAHWNYFMKKCRQDKINAYAAQSAFFIIVSIIPFLMVFSSLLQYPSVTESMLLELMRRIIPEYLAPFFISLVDEVYNRSMGIISATALVAVWSAAKGVQYLADGFNSVHDLEETRNWFVLRFWAILYTLVFLAAIILTLSVIVFGNSLRLLAAQYLPILSKLAGILSHLKGLWMLAVLILFFDIIFTTLPNRKLTLKSQLPGALFCSIGWYLFSSGVSIYVDYFNGFSMYGSLTTIVLVMLWFYFCIYIMMIAAEINVVFGDHFKRGRRVPQTGKST